MDEAVANRIADLERVLSFFAAWQTNAERDAEPDYVPDRSPDAIEAEIKSMQDRREAIESHVLEARRLLGRS